MTMAPVLRCHHDDSTADELYEHLRQATREKWPMGAGTSKEAEKYGLASGHAYSVLRAYEKAPHGKVVDVYNPWHSDGYHGKVPNPSKEDGEFTMTIGEYKAAFQVSSWARVHNDYHITSKLIQTELTKASVWKFHMSHSKTFYVSVNWPSHRIVEPCEMLSPEVTLAVTKDGDGSGPVMGSGHQYGIDSAHAVVTKGAGDYTVTAYLNFPADDDVHEVHLVVYAPGQVQISEGSESPTSAMLKLFAPTKGGQPCHVVFIPHRGTWALREDKVVHGVPTYWSSDGADFAYYYDDAKKWLLIGASYFPKVAAGDIWSYERIESAAMSCGCRDSPDGVAGFRGVHCNQVKGSSAKYGNVKCHGVEHSKLVQRYCPATCEADVCKRATVAPTEKPKPPPPVHQKCEDHKHTNIKVDGTPAPCSELAAYCHENDAVQEKCCATCAAAAEAGGVSNEQACKDHNPPGLKDNHGVRFTSCSQLKGDCNAYDILRERCCHTCQMEDASHIEVQCKDSEHPNLWQRGKSWLCPHFKRFCWLSYVKQECCKTCQG